MTKSAVHADCQTSKEVAFTEKCRKRMQESMCQEKGLFKIMEKSES